MADAGRLLGIGCFLGGAVETPDFNAGKKDYAETRLQMAIADYLNGVIRHGKNVLTTKIPFPGLVWSYTGGEGKDQQEGFWLQRKGRRKGVFDYLSWYAGKPPQALETKTVDGYLSREQKLFKHDFEQTGGVTATPRSVAEVRDFYIGLGIACQNTVCIEPAIAKAEMMKRMWELQCP